MPSEQEELHYGDWRQLVAGIMHDTPLGRIVNIRAETDEKVIRNFGAYEKRIRSEWRAFRDSRIGEEFSESDKMDVAAYFEKMFAGMFGGEK